jgi:hypothetical protein
MGRLWYSFMFLAVLFFFHIAPAGKACKTADGTEYGMSTFKTLKHNPVGCDSTFSFFFHHITYGGNERI